MRELVVAVLIVLVGSAICSGTEAALFSVPIVKVRQCAENHVAAARTLLKIREHMSRPIATVVILNNVFNIVGSVVIGGIAVEVLGDTWLGLFSAGLTFLIIIFSEIVPKTIGERYAEPIALFVARPIAGLTWLISPLLWFIEKLVFPFTKRGIKPITNESEITLLASIGQQEGSIEEDEAALIKQVFWLNDMTAEMLMTPRVSLTYVEGDKTLAEVRNQVISSQHTRILVIGHSIDEVIGIVLKHDILLELVEGRTHQLVSQLTREVRFVPEMVRADVLLRLFQENREHLAVVVDEFGGVAGVVTLEDVLEVLTGEIVDETDRVVDLREWARQRRQSLLAHHEH